MIDIGLLHHLEELARIGAEALDVAAAALGIDGVEGEAGLAGARRPVITVSVSRGMSISTPFRLCSRAPRTLKWVSIRAVVPVLFCS
jgi:hypothetical protein